MRLTWDEYGLALAEVAASRAACTRRKVGAVILDRNHRVTSVGYNGTPAGEVNCSDGGCPRGRLSYDECPAFSGYSNCNGLHAEDNALSFASGVTLYISCEPCYQCRELIATTDIERVVWPEGEYFNV